MSFYNFTIRSYLIRVLTKILNFWKKNRVGRYLLTNYFCGVKRALPLTATAIRIIIVRHEIVSKFKLETLTKLVEYLESNKFGNIHEIVGVLLVKEVER